MKRIKGRASAAVAVAAAVAEQLECRRLLAVFDVDLGMLPGGFSVEPADINSAGQVVGTVRMEDGTSRGFIWRSGVMTDLGSLGGGDSRAYGINDAGQVIGQSSDTAFRPRAYLVTPEDTDGNGAPDRWFRDSNGDGRNDLMRDLGTIGGAFVYATAYDVNNLGQVVGSTSTVPTSTTNSSVHAFRWQAGVMTDLGTFGGHHSYASAINDAGQVTGRFVNAQGNSRAFLWKAGVMTDLGFSDGPAEISASGRVVDTLASAARVWTPTTPNGSSGTFATLGQLPPSNEANYVQNVALGINAWNHVVGYQADILADDWAQHAWFRGTRWINGVPEELPLEVAEAINDAGQIVGMRGGRGWLLTEESLVAPLLTIGSTSVTEGHTGTRNATFTVRLSRASSQTVTVQYATVGGNAAAGSDYVATSGTLTFAPGQTSRTFAVTVIGDRVPEYYDNESFTVALSNPSNALVAGSASATGTIVDDEPYITGSSATVLEGNSGSTSALISVKLSAAYDQPVTLAYATRDGSATAGADYVSASGTVTFAPGQTTRQFSISVVGDRVAEYQGTDVGNFSGTEFILFDVSCPSGNASVQGIGGVFIQDDEPSVSISLEPVVAYEGSAGAGRAIVFTVELSAAYDQELTVEYFDAHDFGSGWATAGSDYTAVSGTLRFAPGQTIRTVSVPVIGDAATEDTEYFYLYLHNPGANTFIAGYGQGVGEIRDDDVPGKTWVGPATGGNWSTAANWSPAGVPAASDLVTIAGKAVSLSDNATVGSLTLSGGATLTMAAHGGRVLRASVITISSTSKLNLLDNNLILDYGGGAGASPIGGWNGTAYTGITGLVAAGRTPSATWNGGGGIGTSMPRELEGVTGLAVAEAASILFLSGAATASWEGQTVDATTVLVKYTYVGDANFDGLIDGADYGIIDNYVQFPGTSGYVNGDFNYDGVIDGADYGLIDNSVQLQDAPL